MRNAINADPVPKADERATQQGMFANVELLTGGHAGLHVLGQARRSSEPPDELHARFANSLGTPLIGRYRRANVMVASGNHAAAINTGQHILAVGYTRSCFGFPQGRAGAGCLNSFYRFDKWSLCRG